MQEKKVNIEAIEIIADDGEVFSLDCLKLSDGLRREAEEYNKEYHRWYAFKNFKVDENKLEVWNPDNWEHFKWEICRKYVKYQNLDSNSRMRYESGRGIDVDKYNSIETSDEFYKFINKIVYSNNERESQFILNYQYIDLLQMYKVLYGSGFIKTPSRCLRIAIKDENYEAVKYCVETLKLDIGEHHISSALNVKVETTRTFWNENIFSPSENDIAVDFKPIFAKNGENDAELDKFQLSKYYYSKNTKDICEFLIKNYKGDLTELCINVLSDDKSNRYKTHNFYTMYKDLNITLPIHSESVETIIQFNLFWENRCKWFDKIQKYNVSLDTRDADSVEKSKLPSKEIIENIFLQIGVGERKKIKDIYKVLKDVQIDADRIMYYFSIMIPYHFSQSIKNETLPTVLVEEYNSIQDVLSTYKEHKLPGGGNRTSGTEAYHIENKEGLPLDHFKKIWDGLSFPVSNEIYTVTSVDYEITKNRDVCTCKDFYLEAKNEHSRRYDYGYNRGTRVEKFPEESEYIYWRCPVHGIVKNSIYVYYTIRKMTFEEYLKYTDKISKDKQKKRLQSEMDELENAQKEIEEKKKKIKSRIDFIK